MAIRIGDAVLLREEAAGQDSLADLAGIEGRVGDVWDGEGGERCNVVYERRGCVLAEAPATLFLIVPDPTTAPL